MKQDAAGRKATDAELDKDLLDLKEVCRQRYERYIENRPLRFSALYSVLRGLCDGTLASKTDANVSGLGVITPSGAKHAVTFKKGDAESEIKAMNDLIDWAWENGGRSKVAEILRYHPPPEPLDLAPQIAQDI